MVKKSRSLVVLFLSISLGIIVNIAPGQNVSIVNPQATIPEPDALWAVQCGVNSLLDSATNMVNKIQGLGYSPVWIEEANGMKKVVVGKCEIYAEAMAVRDSLREKKYYDAFVVSFPEKAGQVSKNETITPDLPLLLPSASAPQIDYASSVPEDMSGLLSLPDADPEKGAQLAEAGRRLLWRDKATEAAMKCLMAVAREQVAAAPEDLKKARWLVAYALHYYKNDKTSAYLAYGEILTAHGDDMELRSQAMMQRVASLLELSWNQKGSISEVQRACAKIDACVPAEFQQVHALRHLLEAECLYCGHKETEALPIFEKLLQQFPEQQRECSVAHLFLALYNAENNQWSVAKNHLNSVLDRDTSDPDSIFKLVLGIPYHKIVGDMSLSYGTKYNDQEMIQKAQTYITLHPEN